MEWGYDDSTPGGEITFCEYMGNESDSLRASYQPDDGQFNPNDDENANYYAGGYYLIIPVMIVSLLNQWVLI